MSGISQYRHEINKFGIDTSAYDNAQEYVDLYSDAVSELEDALSNLRRALDTTRREGKAFYDKLMMNPGCATGEMETLYSTKRESWEELRYNVVEKMADAYEQVTYRKVAAEKALENYTADRNAAETSIINQINDGWAKETTN